MIMIIVSAIISFAITAILAPFFIPMLRKLKFGQSIKEIGPSWHKNKEGTPTMGGIIFTLAILVTFAVVSVFFLKAFDKRAVAVLLCAIGFGIIGLVDDFIKVALKRNQGLTSIQKIILQVLICIAFLLFLKVNGLLSTIIVIPFTTISIDFGIFYYILAIPFMVYMVNAVNLTDGVDGLAASVTVPVMIAFLLISFNVGAYGMTILAAATIGGCLGFLIYNLHPASIFMGDTGSLFLGGMLVAIGIALNNPIAIIICGFVYVFEALSVVIQVVSFKLTKKRVFKMSPIHHHFEMCHWSESKIVYVFTIVSIICSILGYISIR
ncbi:MAG: phospho-N-acetylmuramoyl-pentapeptide-transferase [Clostridia bacterium]